MIHIFNALNEFTIYLKKQRFIDKKQPSVNIYATRIYIYSYYYMIDFVKFMHHRTRNRGIIKTYGDENID